MNNNAGLGIGLSSDFGFADRLWAQNQARQAAGITSQKKAAAAERTKVTDYVTKYINTASSGIHPIYQPKLQGQTTEYLTNLYSGLQRDPNYAKSAENIQAFQALSTNLDKWQQSTENIGKTAAMVAAHPDDLDIDIEINDPINNGDYEGFVKANGGNDFFNPMTGVKGITNMTEANKAAQTEIYKDYIQGKPVKQNGFITIDDTYTPDLNKHRENAFAYYKSHKFAAQEWDKKGGFEGFYKALEKPTAFKKPRYAAQESKGFNMSFGGGGGGWQNSSYNATPLTFDPTTKKVTEISFAANGANKTLDDYRFEQIDTPILGSDGQPITGSKTKDGVFVGNVEGTPIGIKNINGVDYVKVKPKDQAALLKRPNGKFEAPINADIIYVPYEKGNINIVEQATRGAKDDKGYVLSGYTLYGVKGGKQTQAKAETPIKGKSNSGTNTGKKAAVTGVANTFK